MKKTLLVGSSLGLLLSTGLAFNPTAHAAENGVKTTPKNSYSDNVSKENRAIDISSLPQQNLDSLFQNGQAPFNPIVSTDQPNYVHPTEGTFNWKFVNTTYGDNVFYNQSSSFLFNAATAGFSAGILAKISGKFATGVAGYILGGVKFPQATNYWWVVKKWTDQDAYNVYVKYDVKLYSNSSRTKLVSSYSEQFAERYR
ncbi:hypothetical protein [Bacillus mycoides]|uniref:hypothetical protein n=1 Tax=Bacillus mycoides TaxID=1405 RepID=UPI003CFDE867